MWGKLLKFPAHPPYKPIRSTHEQRSETGASKRTKISCGSRSGSSGVVRGRQGSSGVVRGRQGPSGAVRGRQGSSGAVRGRQGSSGVVRGRQGSSGVVRGRQGSSGVVRGRQGSSGAVRGRQESSGVVRSRQRSRSSESSGVVRSRQLKLDNCCCHLCLYIIYIYIYIYNIYVCVYLCVCVSVCSLFAYTKWIQMDQSEWWFSAANCLTRGGQATYGPTERRGGSVASNMERKSGQTCGVWSIDEMDIFGQSPI